MLLYVLRGVAVSLSVFVLSYTALRLCVAGFWRLNRRLYPSFPPNLLFALQVVPFVGAALIVGAFTIPSFLEFEPRVVQEAFGPPVLVLSLVCISIFGVGFYRALEAYRSTTRLVREWHRNAKPVPNAQDLPLYQTRADAPPFVVAGLWRPKLLMSSSTSLIMSEDEVARAISHETSHIRQHDNLKKLVLRLCSYPRSKSIEHEWLAAVELHADRQAVRSKREALDLASALVKASRLRMPVAEFTTHLTSEPGSLLQARVKQLLDWEATEASAKLFQIWLTAGVIVMTIATISTYQTLLLDMHWLAELLMR